MSYPSACITNRRIPTVNCCIHLVVPNHTWKIKVIRRPLFTLRFFHLSSFLDKLYVMSSNEALAHFMRNPRLYLAPHLPRPPCKVCVLGPPHSGKTTVSRLVAQRYNAKVILPPSLSLVWSANFIGQKNVFPIALIDLLCQCSHWLAKNLAQSRGESAVAYTCFPALDDSCVYLLGFLIGLLFCVLIGNYI